MIPDPTRGLHVTTSGGFLLVLSVVIPIAGALIAFAVGGRWVRYIAFLAATFTLMITVAIVVVSQRTGAPLVYLIGAWAPPLGVALRADGLSFVMLAITALVMCAIGIFARAEFPAPTASPEARTTFAFWILWLAVWGALNTIFLGQDLFTLYVALELLTFAAVPLVCLDGRGETLQAALRYLLFALLGSVFYLAGAALLYGTYGTLDIALLLKQVRAGPETAIAAAVMTVGLLAKTALFPLHLWLPPAHAGAPPAASAVLSALVVKGSFFLVVRLWFNVMPGLPGPAGAQLLAALGAAAIVFGSIVALRQRRLKLLIAYSTLAQIGYLFLMFPLASEPGSGRLQIGGALAGGMLQVISHATAKAAMFMAAGVIYVALGHDRITGLTGIGRALPVSVLALALGGVSLIGVPPSGAYLAKELLLNAAETTEQWWWAVMVQAGGILTSSYVLLVLAHALVPAPGPVALRAKVSRIQETSALTLALCSLLLGLVPWQAHLPLPVQPQSNPLDFDTLSGLLGTILAGGALAVLWGRWGGRYAEFAGAVVGPARHAARPLGEVFDRIDHLLAQWPAAGVAVLALTLMFATAILAGR